MTLKVITILMEKITEDTEINLKIFSADFKVERKGFSRVSVDVSTIHI